MRNSGLVFINIYSEEFWEFLGLFWLQPYITFCLKIGKIWNSYHKLWHYLGLMWIHWPVFIFIHRCAILKLILRNIQFAVSRQQHFSFLEFPNGGWDSKVDIIFNKMLDFTCTNVIHTSTRYSLDSTDVALATELSAV